MRGQERPLLCSLTKFWMMETTGMNLQKFRRGCANETRAEMARASRRLIPALPDGVNWGGWSKDQSNPKALLFLRCRGCRGRRWLFRRRRCPGRRRG